MSEPCAIVLLALAGAMIGGFIYRKRWASDYNANRGATPFGVAPEFRNAPSLALAAMTICRRFITRACFATVLASAWACATASQDERALADADYAWPTVTNERQPWCYGWWMGSAVDRENLGRELRQFRAAGLVAERKNGRSR